LLVWNSWEWPEAGHLSSQCRCSGKGNLSCLTAAWSEPGRLKSRAMTADTGKTCKNIQYLPKKI